MTPSEFVRKWSDSELRERQASQSHFNDLCKILDVPTPTDDDAKGDHYCFERGAEKVGGGDGWADVWRRHCFGWEYKGKHKDLNAALRQLQAYALDLENPPYLVVSDMERIVVHTNWTNTVTKTYEFSLQDLLDPPKLHQLRAVFDGSEELKPRFSPQDLTAKAAERFGELSKRLQERKHDPRAVAHFLNRLVFCMFAEDAGLLPPGLFSRTLKATAGRPTAAQAQLADLFDKMSRPGDTFFGPDLIRWFNGGLFDDNSTLPLESHDLQLIAKTAEEHDWSQIDPAVFGTLFEQALKASRERPALGAHYTDRQKILKIVEPVIVRPLAAEWSAVLENVRADVARIGAAEADRKALLEQAGEQMKLDPALAKAEEPKRRKKLAEALRRKDQAYGSAKDKVQAWLDRLAAFRVLDPACGSGNFLYVALHELMDLEQRAIVDAERLGLTGFLPQVGLQAVRGIEIDRYAAELARLTLWIGYLQWTLKKATKPPPDPVLSTLDQIENRDALLNQDGSEAGWPDADVIIGNPPFVGASRMIGSLGEDYVTRVREIYRGRVGGFADFVCFWFAKSLDAVLGDRVKQVGLVATNSIRGGENRAVLDRIAAEAHIYEAWSDEPWVLEGAAVRVSLVIFDRRHTGPMTLDGRIATHINADLTSIAVDLTKTRSLTQNQCVAYLGTKKGGPFDIPGSQARMWLQAPVNPNNRSNADVLRPRVTGTDIVRRPLDEWVIDFGTTMSEENAALYQAPFQHALLVVKPVRDKNRREIRKRRWWLHSEPAPAMRKAVCGLSRFIGTARVSKFRIYVWLHPSQLIDDGAVLFARDDDFFFGVLHSRFHELWAIRKGTHLGVGNDPRYTPSTTFDTFPFPDGLTPDVGSGEAEVAREQAIAEAARRLNELREAWLNPPDLVVREPEVVTGYPDRILPRDEASAKELKTRTLTNLYNLRPAWLEIAHKALDEAVAAAYGWPADLSDDEILERLFALNQERAAAGR